MNSDTFINIGFDTAIKRYLLLKNENYTQLANDFLVYVIYMLNFIYGENLIINSYFNRKNNGYKTLLEGFKQYNLSDNKISKFFKDMNSYIEVEIYNRNNGLEKNEFFTYLQEDLIDMFLAKASKLGYTKDYYSQFRNLLFFNNSNNKQRNIINQKYAINLDASVNYFDYQVYQMTNTLSFVSVKDNLLSNDVYKVFGLSDKILEVVSEETLSEINKKIYAYFNINPLEIKANKKLEKASSKLLTSHFNFKLANNSGRANILIFVLMFIGLIGVGIVIGLNIISKI